MNEVRTSSAGRAEERHVSVLLKEAMEFLRPRPGGRYLDGTLGMGGHSEAILRLADGRAQVLGMDRDEQAIALAGERLAPFGENMIRSHSHYSRFADAMAEIGWEMLDGALLDLGVSSLQLDTPERGFSFVEDGPLDMRMGRGLGLTPASRLVNALSYEELKRILGRYGEEPMGGRIARAIVEAREKKEIATTLELASIVENAYPAKRRAMARNHPATKTFQALRIAVNRELEELEDFLEDIVDVLSPGARVVIISFHSLEDRIVKHAFRDAARNCVCPRELPVCSCQGWPKLKIVTRKPVGPGEEEREANTRSRSAKLRAAERVANEVAK